MLMQGIEILGTGHADIPRIVTNCELSETVDTSDEWIASRTGIKARHFVADGVKNLDIATEAAAKALKKSGVSPSEIACVIVATFTSDDFAPSMAAGVNGNLGLSPDCITFDLSAGCSGFMYALEVARGLLLSRQGKYAIVIGSEIISRVLDFEDRNTCVLFGDGSGAVVIGLSDRKYIFRCGVDYQHDKLCVPQKRVTGEYRPHIVMQGQEVFKFAVGALENGIKGLLQESGNSIEDMDYFVCHQANERIIAHVQKKLDIPSEKLYINLDRYGNTSAASMPIAISEMYDKGMLKSGMKIMLIGFGAGLVWGGAYIEI